MRSFATRSPVWIWLNSALMANSLPLDRKVWKGFRVTSVAFLGMQNLFPCGVSTLLPLNPSQAEPCSSCCPAGPTEPSNPGVYPHRSHVAAGCLFGAGTQGHSQLSLDHPTSLCCTTEPGKGLGISLISPVLWLTIHSNT